MDKPFGNWLRQRREALGLSKAECARRAGLSAQRWSQLELRSEQPSGNSLHRVLRAIGSDGHEEVGLQMPPLNASLAPSFLALYNGLPNPVQTDVLEMVRALASSHKRARRS
jgi:transcriptional regulator with XRE-family HTH domain